MKHGMTGTRFYQIWASIKQRCNYKKHNRYANYGGRGIKCNWPDFMTFKSDMYESYLEHVSKHGERNTTIDRLDSDGHYSKENCIWNTMFGQQQNRTNNNLLVYKGESKPLTQWAREKGFNRGMLENRIRRGWSVEKSLETPVKKQYRNTISHNLSE